LGDGTDGRVLPLGLRAAFNGEGGGGVTLFEYAARNIGGLIGKVAEESSKAAEDASEDSIHDLRVSIRRLSETLRVFEDVLPDDSAADIRKALRQAMHPAGTIRNHDIAGDLARKAKVEVGASFQKDRATAVQELCDVLGKWNRDGIFDVWKAELHA
jgi:CHAD domain-containing protein